MHLSSSLHLVISFNRLRSGFIVSNLHCTVSVTMVLKNALVHMAWFAEHVFSEILLCNGELLLTVLCS